MGYIYMLTSPSGKSYIGQTSGTIQERFKDHNKSSSECTAIRRAIHKHGWKNMKKDWCECLNEDLNFVEELMISLMGTLAPNGYNLREGGGSHGKMSEVTRERMREAQRGEKNGFYGKTHTEKAKQQNREAQLGKVTSEETKQKQREALKGEKSPFYGKAKTDEHKQKNREAHLGKTHTKETKQRMSEARLGEKNYNSKMVYQYNLDGTFINSFGSTGEAARHLVKICGSKIRACARGKQNTAYGFKWSYVKN